jgi:hypothetical protein
VERNFQLLPGVVQVVLEHGEEPEDIVPVLSEAALAARTARLENLLVISGVDDPATPEAVSRALDVIGAFGLPGPRKIAFVACMLPQYSAYHFAEGYALKFGIAVKVMVSVQDARAWLAVRESALPGDSALSARAYAARRRPLSASGTRPEPLARA